MGSGQREDTERRVEDESGEGCEGQIERTLRPLAPRSEMSWPRQATCLEDEIGRGTQEQRKCHCEAT